MNKPLSYLETGSYQPIAYRPLHIPRSVGIKEASVRNLRALLSNVGCDPISDEQEQVAADALSRIEQRSTLSAEAWADEVSQEYKLLRG